MTIEQQLKQHQIAAMKGKEKVKLNAIRSVQAEISTARSAPGFDGEVDDKFYIKTISTYVKQISKSKAEYDAMGEAGAEQSEKLTFEIEYLGQYLPTVLDEDATRSLVSQVLNEMGAGPETPAGRVIGAVMSSGQDVDGALVNRLVNEAIANT